MTETRNTDSKKSNDVAIENLTRRKVVKSLAAGAGALAAYHTLPVNWSTPIIEQVFLPAHAQTSGEVEGAGPISCRVEYLRTFEGRYYVQITATVNPPVAGVLLYARLVETATTDGDTEVFEGTETSDGPIVTDANGIFSVEFDTVEIENFVSLAITFTVVETGASASCIWTGP